jgi:hypothetical protein
MKRLSAYFFLIAVIVVSCSVQNMGPREYMQWVKSEQNGLRISKEISDYKFTLQYKPVEFEALLHLGDKPVAKPQFDSLTATIKDVQFFTFCINTPDKKDPARAISLNEADYNQRLNYLMFEMQNDFYLVDGKDTLPCLFYHYERNFDVSPDNNILLGFERDTLQKEIGDKTLIYDDKILETGPVILTVKSQDIKSVPTLKLNN